MIERNLLISLKNPRWVNWKTKNYYNSQKTMDKITIDSKETNIHSWSKEKKFSKQKTECLGGLKAESEGAALFNWLRMSLHAEVLSLVPVLPCPTSQALYWKQPLSTVACDPKINKLKADSILCCTETTLWRWVGGQKGRQTLLPSEERIVESCPHLRGHGPLLRHKGQQTEKQWSPGLYILTPQQTEGHGQRVSGIWTLSGCTAQETKSTTCDQLETTQHYHVSGEKCAYYSLKSCIHPSTHPFFHPPVHPFTNPPIHPPTHPFTHPSIHSSISSSIHLSILLSTHPPIHLSTWPST